MNPLKKIIVIVCIYAAMYGCTKSGGASDPCAGLSTSFAANVQPIINANCAINSSCHAAGSTNSGGPLTDHAKVSAHSSQIKFQIEAGLMPKTGSITTAQKNTIICWISSGSPNN